ncbi:MAG TPA: adenylate/guanylate cyclase domain-containing protein [Candidatus Dormibacteraeota bacterium]|nr:adenylate/guanylate cyclase domain-containing protein [Candidatus Dormibacteraeota bacterium]
MQPGIVGLRGALIAAWEDDLRAVRQDSFDVGKGREPLVFTQRLYGLISNLRPQIQKAWGPGNHVHVVDAQEIGGPGPRVSQSRVRLRNHGDFVAVELFSYADGASHSNRGAGLDRELNLVGIEPLAVVRELYRLAIDFLQVALNIDLMLSGSAWLYEHVAAAEFVASGRWPNVGEVYRKAAREFAVGESFEAVQELVAAPLEADHANGSAPVNDTVEMRLSIEQLQRYLDPQPDLESFVRVVHVAVAADVEDRRVTSAAIAEELGLDLLGTTKAGRLVSGEVDVVREAEFLPDFSEWSFLPSYNVHFFRRAHTIDDFLAVQRTLAPHSTGEATTPPAGMPVLKIEEGSTLPDGIVTFLMTDVVESTLLWLQSRAAMYQAMRQHDQLLTAAIEASGGVVLKERGEGDSFFAVFQRATDAVGAAVEIQRAVQGEQWPQGVSLAVRVSVLTGEADSSDRDYRSPAVNRCAKLRRRAVGNQILVSETTYSIVADILRHDIRLVSVGKRLLEGHERPEEVYVVQHPEVRLEAEVAADEIFPTLSVLPGLQEQQAEPGLA